MATPEQASGRRARRRQLLRITGTASVREGHLELTLCGASTEPGVSAGYGFTFSGERKR